MLKVKSTMISEKLVKLIKNIIIRTFLLLGLEIRWVRDVSPPPIDPIAFNSVNQMNRYWSDSKRVEEYLNPERIDFYHEAINLIVDKGITLDQKDIADVGCGTGELLKLLSEKVNNATLSGFDFSDAAIRVAKKTCPEASFCQFDIYKGGLNNFDVVFCCEVLEHLLYPSEALQTLLKTVRPNGTVVITVPDGRTDAWGGHVNFWSPESWAVFIETNCKGYNCDTGIMCTDDDVNTNYTIIRT